MASRAWSDRMDSIEDVEMGHGTPPMRCHRMPGAPEASRTAVTYSDEYSGPAVMNTRGIIPRI